MLNVMILEAQRRPGTEFSFSFCVSADALDLKGDADSFVGDIVIEGSLLYTGTEYRVRGAAKFRKSLVCDLCLDAYEEEQVESFEDAFFQVQGRPGMIDENSFAGDRIDLTMLFHDTVLAAQPISNVCKSDCKGLCPICGKNRNAGDCSCRVARS